ncbi:MAG TPA: FKBP-type peptidyl-prolyl cis-trans isomerase [Pilimelia sp.]|nr:FKBP-type peptidyl-prolyl cis-trans isomerase [Pilimelia sp.]
MRRFAPLLVLVLLAFPLAACGDDPQSPDVGEETFDEATDAEGTETEQTQEEIPMVEGDAGVTVTGEPGAKPQIQVPGGEPPAQLTYTDLVVGDGEAAPEGANVSMHYVGVSWSNGEEFDSSWDRGQTLNFPLSQLILGWQRGVPGMNVGGRRLLVIPPDLGYGPQGTGPIGPNETLVFVIDLVGLG